MPPKTAIPNNLPGADYSQSPFSSLISKVNQDKPPSPEVLVYIWRNLHASAAQNPMARPSKAELQTLRQGTLRTLSLKEKTSLRTVMRLWGEVEAIVEQFPGDRLYADERQILVNAVMESFKFEMEVGARPVRLGNNHVLEPTQTKEDDVAVCLESLEMLLAHDMANGNADGQTVRLSQEQRVIMVALVGHYFQRNGMAVSESIGRMEGALRGLLRKRGDDVNGEPLMIIPPDSSKNLENTKPVVYQNP